MNKVNKFLAQRLKRAEKTSKMTALATQSANGNLTSFSGIFGIAELNQEEKKSLSLMLKEFADEDKNIDSDLRSLITLTSEVKAINNQAIILHGERIKRVQEILKRYKDGAFTAWLINTYGNRQTPYNFLQYYEFYMLIPPILRPLLESMPKQAIYTLASRDGALEQKETLVKNYGGESKKELIALIRDTFPLSEKDKRRQDIGQNAFSILNRLIETLSKKNHFITEKQKSMILDQLKQLESLLS